jgi:hypothetical protein
MGELSHVLRALLFSPFNRFSLGGGIMKKVVVCLLAFLLFAAVDGAQKKYVGWSYGYLPNYANFPVSKVNWKCYTILAWFSINGNSNGTVSGMTDANAKAFTTACHQNKTKAIICVGGAGAGGAFQGATQNSVMPTFVHNLVDFMKRNAFDGIDIDWEDGLNSQFVPFMKMLNDTIIKTSPKPLVTIATAQYLAASHAPAYPYVDQLNIMSYYDLLNSTKAPISGQVNAFTSRGVPKSKLGIGYGYDVDNEVDGPNECGNGPDGNPGDINAKILYSINNGCGGIMIWEIDRAPRKCDSVTALYVNKNPTSIQPLALSGAPSNYCPTFAIVKNGTTGASEIRYNAPSAEVVTLELFNMKGALISTLVHGPVNGGLFSVPLSATCAPGTYIVKMSANTTFQAATAVIGK